jgi:hypothetical protein
MTTTWKALFFLFVVAINSAKAEYVPVKLFRMILGSDKIVYGEIVELDSLTYTLKIEQNLTGTENYIQIQRFYNWSCAWRWTEYQVGQKLFLFLANFQGTYRTISAGNEGELPIVADTVYIHGRSLNSFNEYLPDSTIRKASLNLGLILSQHYDVYGDKYYGHKMQLTEFIEMVQLIRNCYTAEYQRIGLLKNVSIHCAEKEISIAEESSQILKWMTDELLAIIERQKNPQIDLEQE